MANNNMTEGETPAEEIAEEANKENAQYNLKVLSVVREAQLGHGLRHNDYQLYRQYCSKRIRRIRKNLSYIQGDRKNFRKKDVTPEVVTKDEKFLLIPLMTVERCWAYAMQLKTESHEDSRKKFHMRNKLRKASKYVIAFEKLVEECGQCDARTQLEVQGYSAWLQGTVLFELAEYTHEWGKPVEFFNKAHAIYSKLSSAITEDEAEIYGNRLQELEVKLRFCKHHLGDRSATDTLLAMKTNEALGDKLDNLLAAAKERQASTLSEVTWKGRTLAVKHEKVRMFLLNEDLVHEELAKTQNANDRVEMLDNLLMECKDAMQLVREDLKNDPNFKTRQQANEGAVSPLHFLHTYLTYLRLNLTVLRNVALVHSYTKIISGEETIEDGKKAPRLQDVVRLYDIILQHLNEIPQLSGLEEDLQLRHSMDGQAKFYKAHRCFYVAESFSGMEKWNEALVLYERTLAHIAAARKHQLEENQKNDLEKLAKQVDSKIFSAHAQSIIMSESSPVDVSKLSLKEKTYLEDRLDEYVEDSSLMSNSPLITQVPPKMVSVPCKPLFFDLAQNQIDFPNLDDKIESKKAAAGGGGLTGLVKGLWGWGGKK